MKNKALKNIMVLTLVVLGFFAIYNMGTSKKQTDNSQEVQNTNDTVEEIKPSVQKKIKTEKNVDIRILILIIIVVVVISALIGRRNTEATASLKSNKKEKTNASKLSDESQTINDNNPDLNEHEEVNDNDNLNQNKENSHQENINPSNNNIPPINEIIDNQDTQQELIPSDNEQPPYNKTSPLSKFIIKKQALNKLLTGNKKTVKNITITNDNRYIMTGNVEALIKQFLVGNKDWGKNYGIVL